MNPTDPNTARALARLAKRGNVTLKQPQAHPVATEPTEQERWEAFREKVWPGWGA